MKDASQKMIEQNKRVCYSRRSKYTTEKEISVTDITDFFVVETLYWDFKIFLCSLGIFTIDPDFNVYWTVHHCNS